MFDMSSENEISMILFQYDDNENTTIKSGTFPMILPPNIINTQYKIMLLI
jgi:hypothetical protein